MPVYFFSYILFSVAAAGAAAGLRRRLMNMRVNVGELKKSERLRGRNGGELTVQPKEGGRGGTRSEVLGLPGLKGSYELEEAVGPRVGYKHRGGPSVRGEGKAEGGAQRQSRASCGPRTPGRW